MASSCKMLPGLPQAERIPPRGKPGSYFGPSYLTNEDIKGRGRSMGRIDQPTVARRKGKLPLIYDAGILAANASTAPLRISVFGPRTKQHTPLELHTSLITRQDHISN